VKHTLFLLESIKITTECETTYTKYKFLLLGKNRVFFQMKHSDET
jgi:hypothetical protein